MRWLLVEVLFVLVLVPKARAEESASADVVGVAVGEGGVEVSFAGLLRWQLNSLIIPLMIQVILDKVSLTVDAWTSILGIGRYRIECLYILLLMLRTLLIRQRISHSIINRLVDHVVASSRSSLETLLLGLLGGSESASSRRLVVQRGAPQRIRVTLVEGPAPESILVAVLVEYLQVLLVLVAEQRCYRDPVIGLHYVP